VRIKALSVWFMTFVIFERAELTLGEFMIINSHGVTCSALFKPKKSPLLQSYTKNGLETT